MVLYQISDFSLVGYTDFCGSFWNKGGQEVWVGLGDVLEFHTKFFLPKFSLRSTLETNHLLYHQPSGPLSSGHMSRLFLQCTKLPCTIGSLRMASLLAEIFISPTPWFPTTHSQKESYIMPETHQTSSQMSFPRGSPPDFSKEAKSCYY